MKKTEYISIRIHEETKNKLLELAEKEERSLSWIVNKIIENHFKEEGKKDGANH